MEWENFHYKTGNIFHVNSMEDYVRLSQLKELPLPHHRKEVYDFIFLTKGTIVRSKGLDTFTFSKNTFFFLPASQVTHMQSATWDVSGYYCHFDAGIFYNRLFQKELLQQFSFLHFIGYPLVEADDKTALFALQLLQRLEEEYKRDEHCNTDVAASILLALFFDINRFARQQTATADNAALRIANEYKKLLQQHIFEKQKVSAYADMLAVSPEHLNRSVKAAFGKTAHHYLDETILLEAKVLLKQSSLNISEIAYKIGRENPGDFIRFFKSKTGITPKQYRANI